MKSKNARTCGCSQPPIASNTEGELTSEDMRKGVRKAYAQRAKRPTEGSCCEPVSVIAQAGYSQEELNLLPESARNVSAGCGNPTALADLKSGEVVLDLGSGGGIDVFLAARKVGPEGKAIGVDMTPEMIDRARANARKSGLKNVEFRLGEIEHLPVPDESVDVIISNCVINLSPEKEKVFQEAHRVLKKGGRILVSDMMVQGMPNEVRRNLTAWASCIGGAIGLDEYLKKIREAGFTQVDVVNNEEYSRELIDNAIQEIKSGQGDADLGRLLNRADAIKKNLKVSHAEIRAVKT
ncbi:MAG: arsenite methyltransferase [Candidatus Atabeyarchaeum deiterrae]